MRLLLLPALLLAAPLAAQTPGTDIWVAPLGAGAASVGRPVNVTRSHGYDNQPAFTPDGAALLFASVRAVGQMEIFRVPVAGGPAERLTTTLGDDSEYSPTPLPGGGFAVVRVQDDEIQRLWAYEPTGENGALVPRLLLDVDPVGYFAFAPDSLAVLFVLGPPNTLQVASLADRTARVVAADVGRTLLRIPGSARVSFVQKGSDGWWIAALDPATGAIERLAPTLPEVEDFAWADARTLVAAQGSTIHRWRLGASTAWTPVADLARAGLRGITRLAVSPAGDRIAIVAPEPAARR